MQIHLENGKSTWKQEWAEVGGKRCFFRSRWEYRYALYLELMKANKYIIDWEHEPHIFYFEGIKRGTTNYKPDFKVTFPSGNHEWHEVKGYMDKKSMTKIRRMKIYYPSEVILLIQKDWFQRNSPTLKKIFKQW